MPPLMLLFILHIFIGSTLAGSGIVVALTMGYDTLTPILIAAALGFCGAFPLSWVIAKQLDGRA